MSTTTKSAPPALETLRELFAKAESDVNWWTKAANGVPNDHKTSLVPIVERMKVGRDALAEAIRALEERGARPSAWQPIETWTDNNDGVVILRPHTLYGAMDVRHKPGVYDGKHMDWVNGDYTAAWPEEAFLPFWMPVPPSPPTEAVWQPSEGAHNPFPPTEAGQ